MATKVPRVSTVPCTIRYRKVKRITLPPVKTKMKLIRRGQPLHIRCSELDSGNIMIIDGKRIS